MCLCVSSNYFTCVFYRPATDSAITKHKRTNKIKWVEARQIKTKNNGTWNFLDIYIYILFSISTIIRKKKLINRELNWFVLFINYNETVLSRMANICLYINTYIFQRLSRSIKVISLIHIYVSLLFNSKTKRVKSKINLIAFEIKREFFVYIIWLNDNLSIL